MTLVASSRQNALQSTEPCAFCSSSVLDNQKVYEDDQVIILYSYKPIIEGHCLVIPKRHYERLEDLNNPEITALHQALKKLYSAAQKTYQATGYLIFQKNGKESGQSVPHVHFHFLPRKEGDYTDIGMYVRLFLAQFKSPLPQDELDLQRQQLAQHFVDVLALS